MLQDPYEIGKEQLQQILDDEEYKDIYNKLLKLFREHYKMNFGRKSRKISRKMKTVSRTRKTRRHSINRRLKK
jgi:L-fucose isomerase-like protein